MTQKRNDDDFHLFLFSLAPNSYWRGADVSVEPQIRLERWTIKQDRQGNRYFVGSRVDDGTGRVSTAIVEFDAQRRRGRTQSGRVYELIGPPGHSGNGEYSWSIYKAVNKIKEADPCQSENTSGPAAPGNR